LERRAAGFAGVWITITILGACNEPPDREEMPMLPPPPAGVIAGASGNSGQGPAPAPSARRPDAAVRRDAPARRDGPGRLDAGASADLASSYPYGAPCDTADYVPRNILLPRCGSCHKPGANNLTNLDVVTPGVRGRLTQPARTCMNRILAVTQPTLGGFLIDKLTAAPGICGSRMPAVGPALAADQIECVKIGLRSTPR
jgi:hypothetical protein